MASQIRNLIVVNAFAGFVVMVYSSIPVFLGAFIDQLGFSLKQAGLVAAAETTGGACGAAFVTIYFARTGQALRPVLAAAMIVLIGAQFGSAAYESFMAYGVFRFLSGVGTGIVATLAVVYVSSVDRPDRPFSILYGLNFFSGGLGLFVFPWLFAELGVRSVYFAYGVACLLVLLAIRVYPAHAERTASDPRESRSGAGAIPWLAIGLLWAAIGINFVFNGGLWIYIERIAVVADIGGDRLGFLLGIGLFCGVLGTLVVNLLGDRIGRLIPLVGAHVALILGTYMLYVATSDITFVVGLVVFNAAITTLTPYVLSSLASWDRSGRSAVIGTLTYTIGYGIGPAVLSFLIGERGFLWAFWIAGGSFALCIVLIVASYALVRRQSADASTG